MKLLKQTRKNISGAYQPLGHETSQRGIGGWSEKKDRGHPSVMSLERDDMSWRTAKVKPRPELPPQDPGGRFPGTYAPGPRGNDA